MEVFGKRFLRRAVRLNIINDIKNKHKRRLVTGEFKMVQMLGDYGRLAEIIYSGDEKWQRKGLSYEEMG